MTRLVLVRHGQAQSYVDGVIGGATGCTGLSDLGRRQARALHDRLARTGDLATTTAVYTSTLPRAIETAELVVPALGEHQLAASCELCELHVDDELDGRAFADFEADYEWPPTSNPYLPWTDGAEPWAESISGAPSGTSLTSSTNTTPWSRNRSTTTWLWTISW